MNGMTIDDPMTIQVTGFTHVSHAPGSLLTQEAGVFGDFVKMRVMTNIN